MRPSLYHPGSKSWESNGTQAGGRLSVTNLKIGKYCQWAKIYTLTNSHMLPPNEPLTRGGDGKIFIFHQAAL